MIFVFDRKNMIIVFIATFVGVFLLCPLLSSAEQRYALLVGCTKYEYLPEQNWLEGPLNDVDMMYGFLTTEMFHFQRENVVRLAGWPENKAERPIRANIEREFTHLAEVAKPGDQILILLAGHGSQQPANDDPNDLEPDGLDEIFLPADVKEWDFDTKSVENAIVDDDLRVWLTAIRNTGAFVWLIIDACHSGTMIRDKLNDRVRDRYLSPEVLIPKDVLESVEQWIAQQPKTRGRKDVNILGLSPDAGDIIAMYAAQSVETTFETRLPHPLSDPFRGIFSYTLAAILRKSASPLTYRELLERVTARYRSQGYRQPTPLIEGGALDREVLDVKEWPERPKILLGQEDSNRRGLYELKMGNLHGLRLGDVLAVYPPAGEQDADNVVGYVEVVKLQPLTSLVKPVKYDGTSAPEKNQLRVGSRCQVVFVNYGKLRMKIAVQQLSDPEGTPEVTTFAPGTGPQKIESALKELAVDSQFGNLVERVKKAAEAEWLIRVMNDQIRLLPISGIAEQDQSSPQFLLGNIQQGADVLAQELRSVLSQIARVSNLMKIAGDSPEGGVNVTIELLRFKDRDDNQGELVPYGTTGRILHSGDIIGFRVSNLSSTTVDVSLLFIDSGYGIDAFFPEPGFLDDNRLPPGKTIVTPRAEITGDTFGLEQLVTIVVKATEERLDFSCLEQPTLAQARAGEGGNRALASPLGQLLEVAMFSEEGGELEDRGMRRFELDNYALHVLDWRTVPAGE